MINGNDLKVYAWVFINYSSLEKMQQAQGELGSVLKIKPVYCSKLRSFRLALLWIGAALWFLDHYLHK